MNPKTYIVQNADGIIVAQYEDRDHAIESARENAAAGFASIGDFYSATDGQGWEIAFSSTTEGEGGYIERSE